MGKRPGMFRGDKKRKEILRHKKQEEKRQRRFHKGKGSATGETADIVNTEMDVQNAENETETPAEQENEPKEEKVS